MNLIIQFTQALQVLATKIPLALFVIIGGLFEEIIAPIPSPAVMTLAGSLTASQGHTFFFLIWLSFMGAIGKTIGTWILYYLGKVAEDVLIKKWGKFFGIDAMKIEEWGKKFHQGSKDIFALIVLRALPIIPTAPISIICGIIKLPLQPYLIGSFLGNFVRGFFYLYLGYGGIGVFRRLLGHFQRTEAIVVGLIVAIALLFVIGTYLRQKNTPLVDKKK